jgi:tubulin polyglutamylase TTLL5
MAERLPSRKRPVLRFQPIASLTLPPARAVRGAYGVPLAYRLQRAQPAGLVAATLRQHGFVETQGANFNLLWTGQQLRPEQLGALCKAQRVNHFPRSSELTRKDRLHVNVQRMARQKGSRHYAFVPKSFLLPSEWSAFRAAWRACRRPYIVKPTASSCGRGIYIVSHPNQVPL